MSTYRKRIGFLPRKEVERIIDKIAISESLSKSKIVGVLVEEALTARGIFDPRIAKDFNSNKNGKKFKDIILNKNIDETNEGDELISDFGVSSKRKEVGLNIPSANAEIQEDDLAILAKIKNLKALGLL